MLDLNYIIPKETYRILKIRITTVDKFPSNTGDYIVLAIDKDSIRGVDQTGIDRFGPTSLIINYFIPIK